MILSNEAIIAQGYDTVKILFPINIIKLDALAQKKLDSIALIAENRTILIYGYADYLGNEPANMDLAKGRALNVKQYLLNKKINAQQILICEGIGEVKRNLPKTKDGYPEDRRVAIFLKRKTDQKSNITSVKKEEGKMLVSEITANGTLIPIKEKTSIHKLKTKELSTQGSSKVITKANSKPITNSRFEQLSELKTNDVMRIESIHFQPTRHFITQESEVILQELLQTLKDYPDLAINIEGHVCCIKSDGDALDTDTYELNLSVNRAKFIYEYLIENGIAANRLGYAGFGKRRPIVPVEKTEEDAIKNRRVEIRVVRN